MVGAKLAAVNHGPSGNTLDVFVRSNVAAINFLRVVGTGAWTGPTVMTNTSGQTIDSVFTSAATRSTDLADVIAIGSNGLSIATSTNGSSYTTFAKLP